MNGLDPVAIVEHAYQIGPDLEGWLQRLAEAVRPHLDCSFGTQAVLYRAVEDPRRPLEIAGVGFAGAPPGMRAHLEDMISRTRPGDVKAMLGQRPGLWAFSELASDSYHQVLGDTAVQVDGGPVVDTRVAFATDGRRWCLFAGGFSPRREKTPRSERRMWQQIVAHLTSSTRLMWELGQARPPSEEAVLGPAGELLHAEGDARDRTARRQLQEAARAIDRARGSMRHTDPMGSLELWRGLVDGRWSLVDRFESDGRRFMIALRNDSPHRDPRALTPRQGQVAHLVALGLSNKEIGYSLGLSGSAVSSHASAALRKLGLRRRQELAFEMGACPVRTSTGRVGKAELAVVSRESAPALPSVGLTPAEEAVVRAALCASSDAEIARQRGRSKRTIANQLRSAFHKLGVRSRAELVSEVLGAASG